VRFEGLHRFNLAVGGDHAANGTALHAHGSHSHGGLVEIRVKEWHCYHDD
jgi:hypothetical protein